MIIEDNSKTKNINKWTKVNCGHFTVIPFGLEHLGGMIEVSKFKKDEEMIVLYMLEQDHSYLFAKLKEGKWELLSLIPEEIIGEIDYFTEQDIINQ